MKDVDRLTRAIEKMHGVQAVHRESVPVLETWNGQTVWQGTVEVFDIKGHAETRVAYGWSHEAGEGNQERRYVSVLKVPPVVDPITAVRASIARDFYAKGR